MDITTWLDAELPKITREFADKKPAIIMAGDLNTTWPSTPFQLLEEEANLSAVFHPQRIDAMLFRSGGHLQLNVTQAEYLFENSLWPTDRNAISDHPAIFTKFSLTKAPEACPVKTKRPMDLTRTKKFQETCKARMRERTQRAKKYCFAGFVLLLLLIGFAPQRLSDDNLGLFSYYSIIGMILIWCAWWWYQANPVVKAEEQMLNRLDAYFGPQSEEQLK